MHEVVCDYCGSSGWQAIYTVQDTNYHYPGTFKLVECTQCHLVFLNPRPSPEEIINFYPDEDYHPFKALRGAQLPEPAEQQQRRASELTSLMGSGRVLDVGCSTGLFLLAMQRNGWQVSGVEPSLAAAAFARSKLQLDVMTGFIQDIDQLATFDLITFWEVLEHTHSPQTVLTHASQLLSPGGYLAASVPNWASWERRLFRQRWIELDTPRHLFHFTPQTLSNYLDRCGFQVVRLDVRAKPHTLANNLLRFAGDVFLHRPSSASTGSMLRQPSGPTKGSAGKMRLIALTRSVMKVSNVIINLFGSGSGIEVLAQKR